MWIVLFDNNNRHSAWKTKREAREQLRVLRENGIVKPWGDPERNLIFDRTVSCENGHYYV